jgi:hypothetical protein
LNKHVVFEREFNMKLVLVIILSIFVASCGKGAHVSSTDDGNVNIVENLVTNCSVTKDEETLEVVISCPDGSEQRIRDGVDGVDGEDGTSCSVAEDANGSGSLISCSDGTTAFIKNGSDGSDGADGADGLDFIKDIVDPCGAETTHGFDEVLLVLQSGDILAHFASGDNQYLTILQKGKSYVTTDGTGCRFTVTSVGEIVY